jgi:hypothetical protein
MAQRRRSTRRTGRSTVSRTAKKARRRTKKGVRRVAEQAKVTPAQRKKLMATMREFEKNINTMTKKYNKILNFISKW